MATIALADNDLSILGPISIVLEAEGHIVHTYASDISASNTLVSTAPDLFIVGLNIPCMDGIALLHQLRQKCKTPVIIISSTYNERDEVCCFKMGADDFIRKPFSDQLLIERVNAVLRRLGSEKNCLNNKQFNGAGRIVERSFLCMDLERHTCSWKGMRVPLTVTESLILHALAQRPGIMKSRNDLMDAAYSDQVYVNDRTIDTHIKRLRKKFKMVDITFNFIETVYGMGYKFKEMEQ